jgi:hypothetical protein
MGREKEVMEAGRRKVKKFLDPAHQKCRGRGGGNNDDSLVSFSLDSHGSNKIMLFHFLLILLFFKLLWSS